MCSGPLKGENAADNQAEARHTLGGEERLRRVVALVQPENLPKNLKVLSDVEIGPVVLLAARVWQSAAAEEWTLRKAAILNLGLSD